MSMPRYFSHSERDSRHLSANMRYGICDMTREFAVEMHVRTPLLLRTAQWPALKRREYTKPFGSPCALVCS